MLIFLRISITIIILLYYSRESFIAELAISFVPYIIGFCILAIIIETFLIIKESKRKRRHKSIRLFLIILVTIFTIGIGTLYGSEFFGFYNQNDEFIRLKENEEGIKVFYANIYYKNVDYKSLQEKIIEENPDIVILVEFSDNHEDEMKDFFKENYPYINRNSWSTMLAGDAVFSKIPLKNFKTTGIEGKGTRKYSYTEIECDKTTNDCEDNIEFYIIHTSAPVSPENFEMRNKQIQQLGLDFQSKGQSTSPKIIIGDFNLSPRSYYYKDLVQNWNLKNALSFQSPSYTWSLSEQGIFRSHIDQLFISPEVEISPIKIENLSGSDHRSFTFNFGVN